ncbi:MAG: flavodoxin family protein [Bacillota bacterium]
MKAVCIVGSPKPEGNTATVAAEILRGLEAQGVQTVLVQLSAMTVGCCHGCKACYQTGECVQDDDVRRIADDMFNADLVIIASPSYWGDVTGQLKVFIDRCTPYCNQNAMRLPVTMTAKGAAVAVRAGRSRQENLNLVHTIEHFLGHLEIPLINSFTVEGIDSRADLLNRPQILRGAFAFGESLACTIRR